MTPQTRRKRQRLLGNVRLGLFLSAFIIPSAFANNTVTVFAAASLADAVKELIAELNPLRVRVSFAASSLLARQIEAGAPAQIFLCANGRWMTHLSERGLIDTDTIRTPIGNRLVVIENKQNAAGHGFVPLDPTQLVGRLSASTRLAIGDPAHVPAGLYAQQALLSLNLWEAFSPFLARADNVRAALALVDRGEAPFGIVYATDAPLSPRVHIVHTFDPRLHEPIRYYFAIVAGQVSPNVLTVFERLLSAQAQAVFARHRFTLLSPSRSRHAQ